MKTRFLIPWVLPCLAGATFAAQGVPQGEPVATVEQAKTEAEVLFERLSAEHKSVQDKLHAAFARAAEAGDKSGEEGPPSTELDDLIKELSAVTAKLADSAKTYAGTEDAVPFLMWRLLERPGSAADAAAVSAALSTIQESHIESVQLVGLLPALGSLGSRVSAKKAASFIAALEAHSPVAELKAMAGYMRLKNELEGATYGTDEYERLSSETVAAAKAIGKKRLIEEVERAIEFASKFSLGMLAPDIEGMDLSGEAFKLSDYQGKVVFLDFWGDW